MAMYVHNADLTYVSVPKCACSSLKRFCYEVDNGHPFPEPDQTVEGWQQHTVHKRWSSHRWEYVAKLRRQGSFRGGLIALIREPVARLVSCYRSKFSALRNIPAEDLKRHDLAPTPDFPTFVDRLRDYQALARPIMHHSRPLSYFMGQSAEEFEKIFDISDIREMCANINRAAGTEVELGHFNSSNTGRILEVRMTDAVAARINSLYQEDLDLFGAFMKIDTVPLEQRA